MLMGAAAGVFGLVGVVSAQAADLGGSMKDAAPAPEVKRACSLSANVALTSQYVFRGFSQTAEHAALQGGIDATCGRFYAGFWGSNLDFGGRPDFNNPAITKNVADIEIDWYGGVKHDFGKAELDFGVIYYSYPAAFDRRNPLDPALTGVRELDYVELKLSTKWKLRDDLSITTTGYYSPEYTNKTGRVFTSEYGFEYTLPKHSGITPSISALLGWQNGDSNRYKSLVGNGSDNYLYWNAGVTFAFLEKFSLDLRYWDTNIDNTSSKAFGSTNFCNGKANGGVLQCDERFVATLKATW